MRSFKDIRGLKSIPTSSREGREKLISELAYSIVHKDDSALQWSPPFHGLTNNEEETFDRLFERLILRYENGVAKHKRSDEQVWRTFSKELEARNLSSNIEELEIETKVETIKFNHAIKNGKWHLLEPVSFDLSSADSITDKAKRLLGQMTLLKGHKSDFRLYFLVGQPSESQNCDAYLKAIKILEEIPFDKSIYPESRADEFAKELSNLTAAH